MKFSDYFNLWLHQNYYKKGVKIGKEGDFYTSVSVGSFFGICIARRILELSLEFEQSTLLAIDSEKNYTSDIVKKSKICIAEIGANEGHLLGDIIQGIYTLDPENFDKFSFCIIEPHERLRELQSKNFAHRFGDDVELRHFPNLDEAKFDEVIFIANELFDSFACEIYDDGKMLYIDNDKPFFAPCDEEIDIIARKFGIKKGEITTGFFTFAKKMAQSAQKFAFITFDYGQMGARNEFSLRVYKAHNVYNFFEIGDLAEFFAVSDLTYSLNFELIKGAFMDAGCEVSDFCTQGAALVKFGGAQLLELFLNRGDENSYKNAMHQFKRLIAPSELGEKFKMIEIKKGL